MYKLHAFRTHRHDRRSEVRKKKAFSFHVDLPFACPFLLDAIMKPPAAENRAKTPADDLLSSAFTQSWRERVRKENEVAERLQRNIYRASQRKADPRPRCMPVPPTMLATLQHRLKTPERQEAAARSVRRLTGSWPHALPPSDAMLIARKAAPLPGATWFP